MARLRAGDASGAAARCEQALSAFPDDANILCLAARSNLALREFDTAREQIEKALALFPDFAAAHDALGDLLLVEQDADGARAAYERALELEPGRAATPQKLARARAMADRASGRRKHPAFAEELRRAARHQRDGEQDKAEAIYRKILKADPEHVEASRLLAGIATAHSPAQSASRCPITAKISDSLRSSGAVTMAPRWARWWTRPELSSTRSASRTGVRETPKSAAIRRSSSGVPGAISPSMILRARARRMVSTDVAGCGVWASMAHVDTN